MKRLLPIALGLVLIGATTAGAQKISPCTDHALDNGIPCVDGLPSNAPAESSSGTLVPNQQSESLDMAHRPANGPTDGQADQGTTSSIGTPNAPKGMQPLVVPKPSIGSTKTP